MAGFHFQDDDLDRLQRLVSGEITLPKKNAINHSSEYAMTYGEIAEVMGISKQRVEQICKRALYKLRHTV